MNQATTIVARTTRCTLLFLSLSTCAAHASLAAGSGVLTRHAEVWHSAIAQARRVDPAPFLSVAAIRGKMEFAYRNHAPTQPFARHSWTGPGLARLGSPAVYALLEALFESERAKDRDSSFERAWRASLVYALGSIRNERATSPLLALLNDEAQSPEVLQATAVSLARIGQFGSSVICQRLIAAANPGHPRGRRILGALGSCRREFVAQHLANVLEVSVASRDSAVSEIAIRALGDIGSSWAWQTTFLAGSKEKAATRLVATEALIKAYLTSEGAQRALTEKALLVVDEPSTEAFLRSALARGADPQAVQSLTRRLDRTRLRAKP